jgi:hypothetical protein
LSAVRSHRFVVDRMAIAGYRLRLPGRLRSAERGAPLLVVVAQALCTVLMGNSLRECPAMTEHSHPLA